MLLIKIISAFILINSTIRQKCQRGEKYVLGLNRVTTIIRIPMIGKISRNSGHEKLLHLLIGFGHKIDIAGLDHHILWPFDFIIYDLPKNYISIRITVKKNYLNQHNARFMETLKK